MTCLISKSGIVGYLSRWNHLNIAVYGVIPHNALNIDGLCGEIDISHFSILLYMKTVVQPHPAVILWIYLQLPEVISG